MFCLRAGMIEGGNVPHRIVPDLATFRHTRSRILVCQPDPDPDTTTLLRGG